MEKNKTVIRVIYADTDKMDIAYHANYLRWFEIGRTELFRSLGLTYKAIEEKGIMLPVSEVFCKFISSAAYDDLIEIETGFDKKVKGGMKFDYIINNVENKKILAKGYTKHACVDPEGIIVRPPDFLKELISS